MVSIEIDSVTKRYRRVTALEEISIAIEGGMVHGLLGPNGSGKTTLIRLIAGLERPTEGQIDSSTDDIGVCFQQPCFFPSLTVDENISIFADLADEPVEDNWIDELCENIRLSPVRHRTADQLSGGFAKKLDLVLALLKKPAILLLDEPVADIDDESRSDIRSFIEMYQDEDRIVLLSTHDIEGFSPILDQITYIMDGRKRFTGGPDQFDEWLHELETRK